MNLLSDPALSQTCMCIVRARRHSAHQTKELRTLPLRYASAFVVQGSPPGQPLTIRGGLPFGRNTAAAFRPPQWQLFAFLGGRIEFCQTWEEGVKKAGLHTLLCEAKKEKKMKGNVFCLCAEQLFSGKWRKMSPSTSNYGKPQMAGNNKKQPRQCTDSDPVQPNEGDNR